MSYFVVAPNLYQFTIYYSTQPLDTRLDRNQIYNESISNTIIIIINSNTIKNKCSKKKKELTIRF